MAKRRGRPARISAPRHRCGKIRKDARDPKSETEVQIMATVLAYRSRLVGPDNARRNEAGYELGRMFLAGKLTARQHRAGCDYMMLVHSYHRVNDIPPPYARSIDFDSVGGGGMSSYEPNPDFRRRVSNDYNRSATALSDAGKAGMIAVREVCVYDNQSYDVDNLRLGLDALAKFFSIPLDA